MIKKFRIFEENEEGYLFKYNKGDIVVLLFANNTYCPDEFRVGELFRINYVDYNDIDLSYRINYINYIDPKDTINKIINDGWVNNNQIRLATNEDIENYDANMSANKYNL